MLSHKDMACRGGSSCPPCVHTDQDRGQDIGRARGPAPTRLIRQHWGMPCPANCCYNGSTACRYSFERFYQAIYFVGGVVVDGSDANCSTVVFKAEALHDAEGVVVT